MPSGSGVALINGSTDTEYDSDRSRSRSSSTSINNDVRTPSTYNVTVKFYGTIPSLELPEIKETDKSYNTIFHKAVIHLQEQLKLLDDDEDSKGLFPATLPLFGLIYEDHSNWFCSSSSLRSRCIFYFRFRCSLYEETQFKTLLNLDKFTFKYLFIQCRDDFLNGRLSKMYSKEMRPKMLGFVTIDFLLPKTSFDTKAKKAGKTKSNDSEQQTLKSFDPKAQIKFFSLNSHIPRKCRKLFRLPLNIIRRFKLWRNIRNEVVDIMSQSNQNELSSEGIWSSYVQGIVRDVPSYLVEKYQVSINAEEGTLGLNNHSKALFFEKSSSGNSSSATNLYQTNLCYLKDVLQLFVEWQVIGDEERGRLKIFTFGSAPIIVECLYEDCLSLASMINIYYKLLFNYYTDLWEETEMKDDSLPGGLNSFGPVSKEDAEKILQEKLDHFERSNIFIRSVFMIRQRLQEYNQFEIVVLSKEGQRRGYPLSFKNGKFVLKVGEEDNSYDLKDLLKFCSEKFQRQIKPSKGLDCESIWINKLFPLPIEYYDYKTKTTSSSNSQLIEDIQIHILEDKTTRKEKYLERTKVNLVTYNDIDVQMIKLVPDVPDPKPSVEDLQDLACEVKRLQHKSFVGFYGINIQSPTRIFIGHPPYGDLQSFLQTHFRDKHHESDNNKDINKEELSLIRIIMTCLTIVDGLQYLESNNITHGNLMCNNILVYGLTNLKINVKIGDPGLVKFMMENCPMYKCERLPWQADELKNARRTIQSEVFSFGTLLWEIVSCGRVPNKELSKVNRADISARCLPKPQCLNPVDFDHEYCNQIRDDLHQMMTDCWRVDPENRPSVTNLLRKFREMEQNFEEVDEIQVNLDKKEPTNTSVPTLSSHVNIQIKELYKGKQLGQGHFGVVFKGTYYKHSQKNGIPVAIKQLSKDLSTKSSEERCNSITEFYKEAKIMESLHHKNVVSIIGVCSEVTLMLIMEYVPNGNLKEWLKKGDEEHFFQISREIAQGMEYLSKSGIVHRDLAARNVLLDENLHPKIADFGLCKRLEEKNYYRMKNTKYMPLYWSAPECVLSIDGRPGRISSKSDVWSYGVVLWEIYMKGQDPKRHCPPQYLESLKHGCPLHVYETWPSIIQTLINNCWKMDHMQRPDFSQICMDLNI